MQFTTTLFSLTCVKVLSFLLWLNNLSFFGFLWNTWTWKATCVLFFLCLNIIISCFVLRLEFLARLQNMRLCIFSDCKMLENQSANSGLEGIVFSEEGFHVWTALPLFTINTSWHVTEPNHQAHVTIGLIVRLVRKLPIRNAHIYPCNSAGYQTSFCALIHWRTIQMV